MGDNFGIHRGPPKKGAAANATDAEDRTQGQILSDFLVQLEDYNPTVTTPLNQQTKKDHLILICYTDSRCRHFVLSQHGWFRGVRS